MEKKILIVDDEVDLLDVLVTIFQSNGWTTESAINGKIALEKLSQFQADVILSDINMPVMDGLQLLEHLDREESEIPLVFVSGFRDLRKMQRAWQMCAFDFLDKPFDISNMLQVTENAFEYGRDYVRAARKRYLKMKKSS
jgi:DNA-binding NtrC family response regulator